MIPPWLEEHCERLTDNTDPTLTNLNLNIRRLNLEQLHALCSALRQNNLLTTLNLTNSLVNNTTATKLVLMDELRDVLRYPTTTLHVLHLSYNQLRAVTSLGEALSAPNHCRLRELHLDYNLLEDDTITHLAHGLANNTQLQNLQLHHNRLTDASAVALANMLQHNTTLQTLDIHCNNIGTRGAMALLQVLQLHNVSIRHLRLDQNDALPLQILTRVAFFTKLNRCGRRHWSTVRTLSAWPSILTRTGDHADVIFWLLQQPTLPLSSSC